MKENLRKFILGVQEAGYNKASEPQTYNQKRGLQYCENAGWGYDDLLPSFKGKKLIELVGERLKSASPGEPLKILDLGCGRGRFLEDCKDRWSYLVEMHGLNARMEYSARYLQAMENIGIYLQQGDVQQVSGIYGKDSMDIIVACKVFSYIPDPFMTMVGMNAVLKEGGVALITDFPLDPLIEGLNRDARKMKKLVKHLQGMGIEAEERMTANRCTDLGTEIAFEADLAFSKIRDMQLPVSYSGKTKEVNLKIGASEIYSFNALTYRLADDF